MQIMFNLIPLTAGLVTTTIMTRPTFATIYLFTWEILQVANWNIPLLDLHPICR